MQEITLLNGQKTQVDDIDFDYLNQWTWHLLSGYVVRTEKREVIFLHHEILKRQNLIIPEEMEVDHKNRIKLDNTRDNLRIVTRSINQHNVGLRYDNTSGHRGVNYVNRNNKWTARIQIKRHRIHLGYFSSFEEAIKARKDAEEKYRKEIN